MKRFEYKTVCFNYLTDDDLDNYGKEGWELVSVVPSHDYEDSTFYFKREIPQQIVLNPN